MTDSRSELLSSDGAGLSAESVQKLASEPLNTMQCTKCSTHLSFPGSASFIQCPKCTNTMDPQHPEIHYKHCRKCATLLSHPPQSQAIQCPKCMEVMHLETQATGSAAAPMGSDSESMPAPTAPGHALSSGSGSGSGAAAVGSGSRSGSPLADRSYEPEDDEEDDDIDLYEGGGGGRGRKDKAMDKAEREKNKKRKDPNAPKRASNAYMVFCKERRATLKLERPDLPFGRLGAKLGEIWRSMSTEEKRPYEARAATDRERYKKEMTHYGGEAAPAVSAKSKRSEKGTKRKPKTKAGGRGGRNANARSDDDAEDGQAGLSAAPAEEEYTYGYVDPGTGAVSGGLEPVNGAAAPGVYYAYASQAGGTHAQHAHGHAGASMDPSAYYAVPMQVMQVPGAGPGDQPTMQYVYDPSLMAMHGVGMQGVGMMNMAGMMQMQMDPAQLAQMAQMVQMAQLGHAQAQAHALAVPDGAEQHAAAPSEAESGLEPDPTPTKRRRKGDHTPQSASSPIASEAGVAVQ